MIYERNLEGRHSPKARKAEVRDLGPVAPRK